MRALRFVLMLLIAVLSMVGVLEAKIHTGIGDIACWDFSDSTSGGDCDITYWVTRASAPLEPCFMYLATNLPAKIAVGPEGVSYEDLTVAPTDPSLYYVDQCYVLDGVYVVKTPEGHYAKLKAVDNFSFTNNFYYVYQDDGSPNFFDDLPLAVETTTWGRIKTLFQAKP
jgi:hypothetical protein